VMGVHLRKVEYIGKYNPRSLTWDFKLADSDATHHIEQVSVVGAVSHFRRLTGYDPDPRLMLGQGMSIRAYCVKGVPKGLEP